MSFGGQTVTLRTMTDDTDQRDRLNQPTSVPSDTEWTGVLFRPYSAAEAVTLADLATKVWRCTGAPISAAVNATAADVLIHNDSTFQIIKVEPFYDLAGDASHVRITCQQQQL